MKESKQSEIPQLLTSKDQHKYFRNQLQQARRIVVKVGTRLLVNADGHLNVVRINKLIKDIANLHHHDKQVVFVSSGAVGAGLPVLGMKQRPQAISDLQMAAAVGQTRLMNLYHNLFTKSRCKISQVLLTHADLKHRGRHLNARNTMLNLLAHRIIPVVNENDVVTVDELRFGDNDVLSALVAILLDADLLIILTTPNGVREFLASGKSLRKPFIETIDANIHALVQPNHDKLSLGGMGSKLQAAQMAAKAGAQVVIAAGKQPNVLMRILQGDDIGTLISRGIQKHGLDKRKRWISYFHRIQGAIIVDQGAQEALQRAGKSLLAKGIHGVEGKFPTGSLVNIATMTGEIIGHGLVEFSNAEIDKIKGKHSKDIATILHDDGGRSEVIHRDNMIIFKG